jgi:pyridoxamine 5'-phosphate oxidase
VERLSAEESDAYFASRPRGSRLSAIASRQSEVVSSREELEARVAELEERFAGAEPPRPDRWGGFRLVPETYELWQNRDDRLHDRLRYRRDGSDWLVERLSP